MSKGAYLCFHKFLAEKVVHLPAEVESRTQGSRPRPSTQKKSEAKDSLSEDRHSRGQGQECSRPRTKDTKRKCSPKKKKGLHKNFSGDLKKKKKKKVFTKIFQAISTKKRSPKNFSSAPQNFNIPKNRAVLEAKAKDLTFEAKDFKICPRGLHLCLPEVESRTQKISRPRTQTQVF